MGLGEASHPQVLAGGGLNYRVRGGKSTSKKKKVGKRNLQHQPGIRWSSPTGEAVRVPHPSPVDLFRKDWQCCYWPFYGVRIPAVQPATPQVPGLARKGRPLCIWAVAVQTDDHIPVLPATTILLTYTRPLAHDVPL